VQARSPLPSRRRLARRPRRRIAIVLRRQPVVFWTLSALAALATFTSVSTAMRAATAGADTYGELVPVIVAAVDLDSGQVIAPGETHMVSLPAKLVPPSAVQRDPAGLAVRQRIVAGEAVVSDRLAPVGSFGIAATLEPHERAIAIPLPAHRPPIEVGQRVDVLATTDPGSVIGRSPTSLVAEAAVVLDIADGGITVAVSTNDAMRIAAALTSTVVDVVINPG
jgi:Flp pilus assembly protein CpaB